MHLKDMKTFLHSVKSCFCKVKGYAVALAVALGLTASAHAEGASGEIDVSFANDLATKLQTAITTFWTDNKQIIISIIGVGVVLSLAWLVYRIFRKGTSRA